MTGTIVCLEWPPGSGAAMLVLRDEERVVHWVPCDANGLVRAVRQFVPEVQHGMMVSFSALQCVQVQYTVDDIGVLASIGPGDDEVAP